jgi:hypothetical protein
MTGLVKSRKHDQKYFPKVEANEFVSNLEIPSGRDSLQNAWLTITLNYSLDFLDSKNPGGIVYRGKNGKGAFVRDSDRKEFAVLDWDFKSQLEFNRRFAKTEAFWNHRFLLTTPRDYDVLDYTSFSGTGWVVRLNVLCLFRLGSGGTLTHLPLKVVRPDPTFWDKVFGNEFRSHSRLYDDADTSRTMRHEVGHALDQLHIMALKGDKQCLIDINANRCYDTPKGEPENIMGRGDALSVANAKPWQDAIEAHTNVPELGIVIPKAKWQVTMAVNAPPRRIPLGVANIGKPREF